MPEFLDIVEGYALLSDGASVPITNFVDEDGEDCDPEDAVVVVCGSDVRGWFTVDLRETIEAVLH